MHCVLFWLLTPSPTPNPVALVLPTITNTAQLVRLLFWQCLGHIAISTVIILIFIIWSLRKHGHNNHNVTEFSSVLISRVPWWLSSKESTGRAGNKGDADSLHGLGRCPGGGYGNPLQYSCQGNTVDRGAWLATVHGVAKSWTWLIWLSTYAYIDTKYNWSECEVTSVVSDTLDPMDGSSQSSSVHGILQARTLEWVAICFSSVQFSSVSQLCPTLCDPMIHSTPGLPVHHQLLEFTHTHVHQVSDAIQPSHPLLSPSPVPNPSQHQSLFQWCLGKVKKKWAINVHDYHAFKLHTSVLSPGVMPQWMTVIVSCKYVIIAKTSSCYDLNDCVPPKFMCWNLMLKVRWLSIQSRQRGLLLLVTRQRWACAMDNLIIDLFHIFRYMQRKELVLLSQSCLWKAPIEANKKNRLFSSEGSLNVSNSSSITKNHLCSSLPCTFYGILCFLSLSTIGPHHSSPEMNLPWFHWMRSQSHLSTQGPRSGWSVLCDTCLAIWTWGMVCLYDHCTHLNASAHLFTLLFLLIFTHGDYSPFSLLSSYPGAQSKEAFGALKSSDSVEWEAKFFPKGPFFYSCLWLRGTAYISEKNKQKA